MELRDVELAARVLRLSPADRVADRASKDLALRLSLDQVVLRASLDRRRPRGLVVEAREDDDREAGRGRLHPSHGLEPRGVGQTEVEEDAVEVGGELGERLADGAAPGEAHAGRGIGELLLDEPRVALVVLHEEHPHAPQAVAGLAHGKSRPWGPPGLPTGSPGRRRGR